MAAAMKPCPHGVASPNACAYCPPDPRELAAAKRERVDLAEDLEAELERKGVSGNDAAEVRAFSRFLRAAGPAPTPETGMTDRAAEAAIEVYGDERGVGPAKPPRWEGDDS